MGRVFGCFTSFWALLVSPADSLFVEIAVKLVIEPLFALAFDIVRKGFFQLQFQTKLGAIIDLGTLIKLYKYKR